MWFKYSQVLIGFFFFTLQLINKPVESCEKENLAASSCVSHFHSESTPGPVPVLLSPVGNKNQCSSTGLSKKNLREINPPLHRKFFLSL